MSYLQKKPDLYPLILLSLSLSAQPIQSQPNFKALSSFNTDFHITEPYNNLTVTNVHK
jgi:hypothetical protein